MLYQQKGLAHAVREVIVSIQALLLVPLGILRSSVALLKCWLWSVSVSVGCVPWLPFFGKYFELNSLSPVFFSRHPPPSPQGTFPQALLKEKSQYPFFNLVSMELSSSYFFETCSWGAADRAPGVSPMLSKGSTTELDLSQLESPGLTSALKCFGEMYSKVSCDCSPILNGV